MVIKLEGLAPLIADHPPANSTTDTDTHPISKIGHNMVNLGTSLFFNNSQITAVRRKKVPIPNCVITNLGYDIPNWRYVVPLLNI